MTDSTFEIAQALRQSHCDRKGHEHECVGEVTIRRGQVCLNCQLCGSGEDIPDWDSRTAENLKAVFGAAGIDWDSLDISAKLAAIRKGRALAKEQA